VSLPPDPIPWDAPSRFGRVGTLARRVLRRAARPIEVRQRAREQQVWAALDAQKERLAALEARLSTDVAGSGHQAGWAAGMLGRRVDRIRRQVDRATALAQPVPSESALPPGSRVTLRPGAVRSGRTICSLGTGKYRELLNITAASFAAYARRWSWDLVLSTEDLTDGRPVPWAKVRLVRDLLDAYDWVFWVDADATFVDLEVDVMSNVEAGRISTSSSTVGETHRRRPPTRASSFYVPVTGRVGCWMRCGRKRP
jgi:hypothetical protein